VIQIDHCEDSFAFLRSLGPGVVDHVITDPPYDAHTQNNQMSGTAMKKFIASGGGGSVPKVELPFAPLEGYAWAADIVRASRRWSLAFCSVEGFGEFRRVVGPSYVRGAIWYKPNSMGQLTKDRPSACYEGIAIMHGPTKKVWNGKGSYGLWVANGTRGEKGRHPNQKPLALCLKLIALFTNRGDTILDPFCGSGRIGEACAMLGRNYLGLDSDPEWVQRARRRCVEAPSGLSDADALSLCTAKRVDILDEGEGPGDVSAERVHAFNAHTGEAGPETSLVID
jgi:site-specific DNA-methyltransferase (adenine-specific)